MQKWNRLLKPMKYFPKGQTNHNYLNFDISALYCVEFNFPWSVKWQNSYILLVKSRRAPWIELAFGYNIFILWFYESIAAFQILSVVLSTFCHTLDPDEIQVRTLFSVPPIWFALLIKLIHYAATGHSNQTARAINIYTKKIVQNMN